LETILRLGCYALTAAAVFLCAYLVGKMPLPPPPRLGYRGIERRRSIESHTLLRLFEPTIRIGAGILARLPLSSMRARQEVQLQKAGFFMGLTPDEFWSLSLLCSLSMGTVFGLTAHLVGGNAMLFAPGALLGWALPAAHVREVIRARAKSITRGLPHAIEIVALCMGAGLDFPGSVRMLVDLNANATNALCQEFQAILEELELGHSRREALLNFADRVRAPAVRDFVNAVVQAEQKGNPLAKVIRVQGRMLSLRRSVAAEEAAARAGVLMILPMMLLLGGLLLLLMGPFLAQGIAV